MAELTEGFFSYFREYEVTRVLRAQPGDRRTGYVMKHRESGKQYALKTFNSPILESEMVWKKRDWPGWIPIEDIHAASNDFAILRQWIEAPKILDHLKATSREEIEPTLLAAIRTIAEAIAPLHREGIAHQRLTPTNIFIRDNAIFVTDPYIQRAKTEQIQAVNTTLDAIVIGDARFLSPEQIRVEATSPATDIYTLGCVLYRLATGKPPFQGASHLAVSLEQLSDKPIAPAEGASEKIQALLSAMLQKKVSDRIPDAEKLISAIDDLQDTAAEKQFRLSAFDEESSDDNVLNAKTEYLDVSQIPTSPPPLGKPSAKKESDSRPIPPPIPPRLPLKESKSDGPPPSDIYARPTEEIGPLLKGFEQRLVHLLEHKLAESSSSVGDLPERLASLEKGIQEIADAQSEQDKQLKSLTGLVKGATQQRESLDNLCERVALLERDLRKGLEELKSSKPVSIDTAPIRELLDEKLTEKSEVLSGFASEIDGLKEDIQKAKRELAESISALNGAGSSGEQIKDALEEQMKGWSPSVQVDTSALRKELTELRQRFEHLVEDGDHRQEALRAVLADEIMQIRRMLEGLMTSAQTIVASHHSSLQHQGNELASLLKKLGFQKEEEKEE